MYYSLATTGLRKNKTKLFSSRSEANEYMWNLVGKYRLEVEKIYSDHHDKTYVYRNGIRFYIQRL